MMAGICYWAGRVLGRRWRSSERLRPLTAPRMATAILPFPTASARASRSPAPPTTRSPQDDLLHDVLAGLQPSTARTYRQSLTAFARWLECSLDDLPTVFLAHGRGHATRLMRRYRGALLDRGLAPASVNGTLAAIRSLVRTARAIGVIDWTVDVPGVRAVAYRDTRGPGVDGVRALLAAAAAHRSPRMAARNAAIIRTLFDLGLRCHELTGLDLEHVERDANGTPAAICILAKGSRERQRLTLTPAASAAIARWIELRGVEPGPLFGLGNRGVAKLVGRLGVRAGIGHARCHAIRHTAITAALDATGGDLRRARAFSRHRHIETLLLYDDNRRNGAGEVADAVSQLVSM